MGTFFLLLPTLKIIIVRFDAIYMYEIIDWFIFSRQRRTILFRMWNRSLFNADNSFIMDIESVSTIFMFPSFFMSTKQSMGIKYIHCWIIIRAINFSLENLLKNLYVLFIYIYIIVGLKVLVSKNKSFVIWVNLKIGGSHTDTPINLSS